MPSKWWRIFKFEHGDKTASKNLFQHFVRNTYPNPPKNSLDLFVDWSNERCAIEVIFNPSQSKFYHETNEF